jgi:hypothetical protein
MKKQTAVEWLEMKLGKTIAASDWFEKAKEMEKQEIIDAVDDPKYIESNITTSTIPGIDSHSMGWFMNGKQYYDHKYGGDK